MTLLQKIGKLVFAVLCWRVLKMPARSYSGELPELSDEERALRDQVQGSVEYLCQVCGERNADKLPGLRRAETFILDRFNALGLNVRTQPFEFKDQKMKNIEAELSGTDKAQEILVVGAHYDTVYGSKGADDNASGVAALLAIAKVLAGAQPRRTVRFVAFANEEHEGFPPQTMGSFHYARQCHENQERIVGMFSLEMLGVYKDEPGSQLYPSPFNYFYPSRGNFIAFVGHLKFRPFLTRSLRAFRQLCRFPSEGMAAPDFVPDAGRSDHWGFWQHGYPAVMVTDTSNFRNLHYHTAQDLPDTLDYTRLSRVTLGLSRMLSHLANE